MPTSPRRSAVVEPHRRTGVLAEAGLRRRVGVPSPQRLRLGPVVVVECVERIPCNPCAYACPRGAITLEGELTNLPKVDFSKCNGCTMCIARCPGLAIFVVDATHSREKATVALPYEMLPRPRVGQRVAVLDRAGRPVGTGRVVKVLDARALDRCAVVTVAVPKRLWNRVRGLRVRPERQEA
ncbi:4Fe-4S ferredoxin [candidate division WOR-3 bacterium]|nr:4Fe-4S ferredoxin [candidate division WOR-3 bacterium]